MNKKLYLILAIVLIAIVSIFSVSYFINKNTISDNNPLVITDMADKEVKLGKYPETIISLSPAATEIVYDLGMGENLLAVDTYSNYPEDTKNKTKLETNTGLNIESIIALKADVIFMSKMGQTIEQYNSLINSGAKIVIVDATSIEETYTMINLMGKVLNKTDKATEIVNGMKKDFTDLSNKARDKKLRKAYFEVSPLQYGLWTAGNNTFENEIMEMLNITNIFNDVEGWAEVSEEQVLARKPEYIVSVGMNYNNNDDIVNEILNRSNWKDLEAVKSKKVYNINPDIISRSTKRLVEGANELYKVVYGE